MESLVVGTLGFIGIGIWTYWACIWIIWKARSIRNGD